MEQILVVDDDPSIVDVVSRVVTAMGFVPVPHTNPTKALEEIGFAVVLSDFNMPGLNGIDLLRGLRANNPHAVRVLFTAISDMALATRAVNDGEVFRLLIKPWKLDELRTIIAQAVDLFRLGQENRRLTQELAQRNGELAEINQNLERQVVERTNGLMEGMIRALDYRDTETQWHSWRVARFTRRIAEAAGFRGATLLFIEQGALLHDVGKIGVRDSILLKAGPLTPEEWTEMRQHPEIGWRMLSNIPYLKDAADIVHQHQERWDGRGYPQALAGDAIVVGARIFSLADTLDAITSDRPYRAARPQEVALAEIRRLAGVQFDPELVQVFLSVPPSDWADIRYEVETMEDNEKHRFAQRPRVYSGRELAQRT